MNNANATRAIDMWTQRMRRRVLELERAETSRLEKRVTIGRELRDKRQDYKHGAWGQLLRDIGLDRRRASELIKESEIADGLCPAPDKSARDEWCTPDDLTAVLPAVDLDPCSNPRSTVRAATTYSLEAGQNGRELPWFGLVYVNGPYSKLAPWVAKYCDERERLDGCGFLVNTDHSTTWWRELVKNGARNRLDFEKRIAFKPKPGIKASTNNRPQTLLMDDGFLARCDDALLDLGELWRLAR